MNPHFLIERERTAKAFKAAVKEGTPEDIALLGNHLVTCERNIQLERVVELLERASSFRNLSFDEPDAQQKIRQRREAILADREANLIFASSPGPEAWLSRAAIQDATPEQLGAHAWFFYARREVSAAQ